MDIDKKQIQRFFGGTSFYSDPNILFALGHVKQFCLNF